MSRSRKRLERGAPLERNKPMNRVSAKKRAVDTVTSPRRTWSTLTPSRPAPIPAAVRKALQARSGGKCEIRHPDAGCTRTAVEASHRVPRGSGGRHGEAKTANDRPVNFLHACGPCHRGWAHLHPNAAKSLGIFLVDGQDPATEPTWYRGRRVRLCDERDCPRGGVHDHGPWTPGADIIDEGQVAA